MPIKQHEIKNMLMWDYACASLIDISEWLRLDSLQMLYFHECSMTSE